MEARDYDHLVVWADREHSANVSYLTGFDPRFEDAVLVVTPTGDPAVLVGNENFATAEAAPLPLRCVRFQDLSLPGQPRDASLPLATILSAEGIGPGSRVGVVGWKTYGNRQLLDVPSYLADELRSMVGPAGVVENATDLLIDAVRRAPRRQRGRATRRLRVGGVPDIGRGAQPHHRATAGDDRTRGGAAARLEWRPAVLPPHADGRPSGSLRTAQPG